MLRVSRHRSYEVPMVMKAFYILEYLRETGLALKVDEISDKTKATRTSTYRIVRTLVSRGYLHESLDARYSFREKLKSPKRSSKGRSKVGSKEEEVLASAFTLMQQTLHLNKRR